MTEPNDAGVGFAALMNAAAKKTAPAPDGMVRDRATGELRPRRRPGRKAKGQEAPKADAAADSGPSSAATEDPAPGWMNGGQPDGSPPPGSLPAAQVQQAKDNLAGLIGMATIPLLAGIKTRDPYCGEALEKQLTPIVDAALPLICRSQAVVRYLTSESDLVLWMNLLGAAWPVLWAFGQHHVLKTVKVVEDDKGDKWAVPADFSQYSTEPAAAAA